MSFDTLAPHYRWMECVLAGPKLQRCRTAFLREVQHARSVLMLGEGNGRFLRAFTAVNTSADILVVDASAGMLARARRIADAAAQRVDLLHADILTWQPPRAAFDVIVSNFFFDCFTPCELERIVPRIAAAAQGGASWLISDFRVPTRGAARWRARWIIAVMYWFFRRVTRVSARAITPLDPLLVANGFAMRSRHIEEWGLLHADLWQRGPGRVE